MDFLKRRFSKKAVKKHKNAANQDEEVKLEEKTDAVEDESRFFPRQISAIVIGAGDRGNVYSTYALDFPERLKIVAVAEPQDGRRLRFQKTFKIDDENAYKDWKKIAKEEKMADAVIITTLDDLHKEPAIAFSGKGYHLLVEKPLAPSLEDCLEVTEACKKNNTILVVGHVLRYMPHFQKVKNLIEDGVIGDVVHVEHMEPIGWYHFAHSYVRGNWRNEKESGFSLLTKSCHDVDLIQTFMQGSKCQRISSFGSLSHFNRQNKPENAGDSCFNCEIEDSCQYSALKLYLSPMRLGFPNHFCNVVCPTGSVEEFEDVLRKGPYSRCVYNCDNDVMSNQVVNMEYEGGKTVSFSMIAFTEKLCQRQIKIFGTKGEMSCSSDQEISVYDFKRQQRSVCPVSRIPTDLTRLRGHGYADYFLMHAFVKSVCNEDQSYSLTGPDDTLESHRLVFMAEKSRVEGRVIDLTVE